MSFRKRYFEPQNWRHIIHQSYPFLLNAAWYTLWFPLIKWHKKCHKTTILLPLKDGGNKLDLINRLRSSNKWRNSYIFFSMEHSWKLQNAISFGLHPNSDQWSPFGESDPIYLRVVQVESFRKSSWVPFSILRTGRGYSKIILFWYRQILYVLSSEACYIHLLAASVEFICPQAIKLLLDIRYLFEIGILCALQSDANLID